MGEKLEPLNHDQLEDICFRLFQVQRGLLGLASLFAFQSKEACYDCEELYGIAQLLKLLSKELVSVEDILRSGHDMENM